MTEKEVRQAVKDAGVKLLESGLVQGTWGNISIRLDEKRMAVTPSAMDYIRMQPEDVVIVDIETLEYDSPVKPTSEKKIHAAIYRDRPEINAVIHSHPLCSSSVASARIEMPVMSEEMERLVGGSAKCGKYGMPSTKALTEGAVEAMKERNACFLANHGVLACGKSIEEAFDVCRVMEESSRAFVESEVMKAKGKDTFSMEDLFDVFYEKIK